MFFLLLLITVGNLALGFGLAVHLGFGPDLSQLAEQWQHFRSRLSRKKRTESASGH
jgi:hypothetical protein